MPAQLSVTGRLQARISAVPFSSYFQPGSESLSHRDSDIRSSAGPPLRRYCGPGRSLVIVNHSIATVTVNRHHHHHVKQYINCVGPCFGRLGNNRTGPATAFSAVDETDLANIIAIMVRCYAITVRLHALKILKDSYLR
jgi:hypothetical protein